MSSHLLIKGWKHGVALDALPLAHFLQHHAGMRLPEAKRVVDQFAAAGEVRLPLDGRVPAWVGRLSSARIEYEIVGSASLDGASILGRRRMTTPPPPPKSLLEEVVSELVCWYQPAELPLEGEAGYWDVLVPALASESAERLGEVVGADRVAELAELLKEAAADPAHPLVSAATRATLLDWGAKHTWPFTQAVFRGIAARL